MLYVALGSISGSLVGKYINNYISGNENLALVIPLFVLFINFLILPWLAKFIHDEAKECNTHTKQTYTQEQEISPLININADKIALANSSLPSGNYLTSRELEIAAILLERHDNQSISDKLSISINTTKVHISRIYQKFQVTKKKDFVNYVNQLWEENLRM